MLRDADALSASGRIALPELEEKTGEMPKADRMPAAERF